LFYYVSIVIYVSPEGEALMVEKCAEMTKQLTIGHKRGPASLRYVELKLTRIW